MFIVVSRCCTCSLCSSAKPVYEEEVSFTVTVQGKR